MRCNTGYYLSEDFLGKGMIRDISSGGWRIQGDHEVRIGMKLTLRMELPDENSPLEIEEASVQWVSGKDFGIRIKKIRYTTAKRLERLIGHQLCLLPQIEH
jgi:hypothetical protein